MIEGPTLGDRIKHGAVPVEESLKLALQIAEALEAAHEKGVIHRDLKPDNIKVTPDGKVKVLDFGLAKAFDGDATDVSVANSPTLSMQATQQGIILGTAAYMSPEQASGMSTDKRADIWAFGVVLFEMLTGRQVFSGETVSHILAAVLERDPQWNNLPASLHHRLRELLERCLEKDAKNRWHDVADVRVDLQKVLADPSGVMVQPAAEVVQAKPQSKLPWVVAVLGILVAGLWGWSLRSSDPPRVSRFDYELPEGINFRSTGRLIVDVSPDGDQFLYNGTAGIYIRSMDEFEGRLIPGTEGLSMNPVFSPDGQEIAYAGSPGGAAATTLMKVPVSGGAPIVLATDITLVFGISWEGDGTILYGQTDGIWQVSENGGTPAQLVATEPGEQATQPQLLPGGEWILFTLSRERGPNRWNEADIVIESLYSGERRVLRSVGRDARYVPTGHVTYSFEDVLFAWPFDVDSLEASGSPVSVIQGVRNTGGNSGSAFYSFSDNGTLTYVPSIADGIQDSALVLEDRQGAVEPLNVPSNQYSNPRISSDGSRLVVEIDEEGNSDLWIYDLSGETQIRRLTQGGVNSFPIWTPDGERITYESNQDGGMSVFWRLADGSGVPERLTPPVEDGNQSPMSWSPDGRNLSIRRNPGSDAAIWILSLDGGTEPEVFYDIPDGSDERGAAFSPSGEWMAFHSDGAGEQGGQIYVLPFPATGAEPRQITQQGGVYALWSPDGNELFYRRPFINVSNEARILGVDVIRDAAFAIGPEHELPIRDFVVPGGAGGRNYDVTPDGQRFVMVFPAGQAETAEPSGPQINIVLNWFEELKERVPLP